MKKKSVLIIDDDESIRDLYGEALNFAEINVLKAKNGEEGVALALEHHPAVMLVDILMPDMNGHQTVSKIRKDKWGKTAHVIYLTNLTDPKDVVHAIKLKPEDYIVKGNTEIKEVVNRVRTAMYS